MNNIRLPEDKEIAVAIITNQAKETGFVGKIFGTKDHAPTNIAGLALVLLFLLLLATIFGNISTEIPRNGLVTGLLSSITFTLGLMFGRVSSS